MPIKLGRDPFARHTVTKKVAGRGYPTQCQWCGNCPKRLYIYSVEPDAGRSNVIPGVFCSIACLNDYHS